MEVMDPRETAKRIHVPTYNEILEKIKSRYPRGAGRSRIDREIARLQTIRNIILDKTGFIKDLIRLLDNLHQFYWRLIEIEFDKREIHDSISCISKSRKLVARFWDKYRILILASEDLAELKRTSSEGRGRMLSTIKKCRRGLEVLRSLVIFLQHLPSIDPRLPTIIVAGPPSTGKSTLINNVSTASIEVAPYPFTTKNIHIGHRTFKGVRIQLIDTPGMLDRDPAEMNQVERRAVAALSEIPGAILYLIDPTDEAYMPLQRQYRLLIKIHKFTGGRIHFIGINKVDIAPRKLLEEAVRLSNKMIEKNIAVKSYQFSALNSSEASRVIDDIASMITRIDEEAKFSQ